MSCSDSNLGACCVLCWAGLLMIAKVAVISPIVACVGFTLSVVACLLGWVFVAVNSIRTVWAIHNVGPARKSLSTVLIMLFGIPLYPIVCILLLALPWVFIGIESVIKSSVYGMSGGYLNPRESYCCGRVHVWWAAIFCCKLRREEDAEDRDGRMASALLGAAIEIIHDRLWFSTVEVWRPIVLVGTIDLVIDAMIVPLLGGLAAHAHLFDLMSTFRASEEVERRQTTSQVQDITCVEMMFGLILGLINFCIFGPFVLALTVAKFPFVLLSCTLHAIYLAGLAVAESGAWCPLAFLGCCFALAIGEVFLVFGICLSIIAKSVASFLWPAYVASGWLRSIGARRISAGCCVACINSLKAGYQVLWASDLLTNSCILMRFELSQKAFHEFQEIARGQRTSLSLECRVVSCLPPVIIGLFNPQSSWDVVTENVASQMNVSTDLVRASWDSFIVQMQMVGQEALESQQLTEDFVASVPPALIVGLPARVIYDTLSRSQNKPDAIVLATGLEITDTCRPRGIFADKIFSLLREAKAAHLAAAITPDEESLLKAVLLSGGGDMEELPDALSRLLDAFSTLPADRQDKCRRVQTPIMSIAIEVSRQQEFKNHMTSIISSLSSDTTKHTMPEATTLGQVDLEME